MLFRSEEKAADGVITPEERKEIDTLATEMNFSRAREKKFEEEALRSLGFVRRAAGMPGLAVSFEPDARVEAIVRMIEPLSLRDKSVLLARLAISLPSHSIVVETPAQPEPPSGTEPEPAR